MILRFTDKIKKAWRWLKKILGYKNKRNIIDYNKDSSRSTGFSISRSTSVESISMLEDSYKKLSDNAKKELDNIKKVKKDLEKAKNEYEKISEDVRETKKLVVFGFLLIVIMVVGVFIGYWIMANNKLVLFEKIDNQKMLYDETIKDQNVYISDIKMELNNLRNIIDNFKILNPYLK